MQESPRVGVRWSIISLNGLSYKDAGEYRCQARNMAGITEAPIKLKVVGVARLSRLPKRKSQKIASKYRKPYQINNPSTKENQIRQNISPSSLNKTQSASNTVSKMFPIKWTYQIQRKKNSSSPKPPENCTSTPLSETFVLNLVKLVMMSWFEEVEWDHR